MLEAWFRWFGRSAAALVVSGTVLVGCGSAVPDEVWPSLNLFGIEGSPPPAVVYEELIVPDDGPPWLLELVASSGTLVLEPDGSYEHLLGIDTLQDGRLVGRGRWADHGVWMTTEAGLAFSSTWIDGHAFTGTRSGVDVVVEFDLHPFVGTHTTVDLFFAE